MTERRNFHASAIVIGTQGFVFVGAPGSGKSSLALGLLAEACSRGSHAAFIGDDQVLLEAKNDTIIASAIPSIEGLAEVRAGGIVSVPVLAAAVMDFAVIGVRAETSVRLPPENETHDFEGLGELALLRLPREARMPLDTLLRLARTRMTGAA